MNFPKLVCAAAAGLLLAGCVGLPGASAQPERSARNVIFFLGDGLGIATMTAARIYAVGEEGDLTLDTLPETAFVKTFANNAQVTDSAASMSAYMTGVKPNNEVLSMSPDTRAVDPGRDAHGLPLQNACNKVNGGANGHAVGTLAELAKARGKAVGMVTTTRVTDATPAALYAHICQRELQNDIAAMLVPGGAGYNAALGAGIDVVLGGGRDYFTPWQGEGRAGKRSDGRNLLAEVRSSGYRMVDDAAGLRALDAARAPRLFGLFADGHMAYDLDRDPAREPSLSEMTVKAMQSLAQNREGYFLMVEGGRIDHALHDSNARRALQDAWAFDQAIAAALAEARKTDPDLRHTLIVATADHDHALLLNGYAKRTGKTTPTEAGVLGLVKRYSNGAIARDLDGAPYTIIAFGNGEKRIQGSRAVLANLDDATVSSPDYRQEATVRTAVGDETHGGTDVFLGAIGQGAERFRGTLDNTQVFTLLKAAFGW